MWRAHKAAGTKIRLQIIGQKIPAHLSPEAEDLRAHWLASPKSRVTGPKTTATNEGARVHPALLLRFATVSGNGALKASTLPYATWDPRNQLARARASGTPWRLTLNMLLSFAQFEREIAGERIRDKIAASKRKGRGDGKPIVEGKTVAGFTNGEEEEVELTKVVPFLVEDEVMRLGATFSKVKNWSVHTVADGQLITGQNPASSGPAAKLLIDTL
jgi:putative intracellular protease/amidase